MAITLEEAHALTVGETVQIGGRLWEITSIAPHEPGECEVWLCQPDNPANRTFFTHLHLHLVERKPKRGRAPKG